MAQGAHVIVIKGQGYELFFMPGEEKNRRRVPANPYAVVAPKHNEFHQHFNTGNGEYRMLAFRGSGFGTELESDSIRPSLLRTRIRTRLHSRSPMKRRIQRYEKSTTENWKKTALT